MKLVVNRPIGDNFRLRWPRLALLAFYAVWFLVIVPGHTRGQISFSREADTKAATCCADDADGEPSAEAKRTCAVCYFTLGLTTPPVIAFDIELTGTATQLAILWSEQVRSTKKFDPFHSRGPPASLA